MRGQSPGLHERADDRGHHVRRPGVGGAVRVDHREGHRLVHDPVTIDGDGKPFGLVHGKLRARYRASLSKPTLLTPGKIEKYMLDLRQTGITVARGHRLRIEIASASFPLWSRNLNTGGHNETETAYLRRRRRSCTAPRTHRTSCCRRSPLRGSRARTCRVRRAVDQGPAPTMDVNTWQLAAVLILNYCLVMSDGSTIEWTDATWNPVRGCTKVSPGCKHCYAETFAERFRGVPNHPFEQGFDLRLVPGALDLPLRWRASRRVLVNSMSDLFHDDVPDAYVRRVFGVMCKASQHQFQRRNAAGVRYVRRMRRSRVTRPNTEAIRDMSVSADGLVWPATPRPGT